MAEGSSKEWIGTPLDIDGMSGDWASPGDTDTLKWERGNAYHLPVDWVTHRIA